MFYKQKGNPPRTSILCYRNLNFLFVADLSTEDATILTQVRYSLKSEVIPSIYLMSDPSTPTPSSELDGLVEVVTISGKEIIMVCDADSHHKTWGSSNCNKQGDVLLAFVNKLKEEAIDITKPT